MCGGVGDNIRAAGDLYSLIISEHLVIVAQCGSKITFLLEHFPCTANSKMTNKTLVLHSLPECIGKVHREEICWAVGVKKTLITTQLTIKEICVQLIT